MTDASSSYETERNPSKSSHLLNHNVHIANDVMLSNVEVSSNSVDTDGKNANVVFLFEDNKAVIHLTNVSALNKDTLNLKKSAEDEKNTDNSSIGIECPFRNMSSENSGNKPVGHATTNNFDEERQCNNIEFSVLRSNIDNAISGSLNHQKHISQNKISFRKEMKHSVTSTSSIINHISISYKLFVIIAVCLTIAIFLLPVVFYYVNRNASSNDPEADDSIEKCVIKKCNFSDSNFHAQIIKRACNVSAALDPDYVDQISYTFEALRTINLPSSQLYCTDRIETSFCDALMNCGNESCVKDILCEQVRQEYCTAEWRMLEARNQTDQLINCTDYGETATLDCSDQFASNGFLCLPLCGEFSQHSEGYTKHYIAIYASSLLISLVGGLTVIIFSFWKKKKMFHFPQILVPINAANTVIVDAVLIISIVSVGRWNILCSNEFLDDAMDNPTTFCTVQGVVLFSGLVLYSLFWLLYIFHLALKLFFPLKSAKLSNSGYARIVYIAEFMIAFLIGTCPSIIGGAISGYNIKRFPPIYCDGFDDHAYIFYSVTIPILTAVCISLILMILILYKVHVHQGIFKRKQKGHVDKQACTYQFTVPEVKIGFVLFYWLILTVMIWTSGSIRNSKANDFVEILKSYTNCMAGGNRKDHDCHMFRQDLEAESPIVEIIYLILASFVNFASLPFVIQFQTVKSRLSGASRRFSTSIITRFKKGSDSKVNVEEDCENVAAIETGL